MDGRAAALNVDVRSFRNAQVESWSTRADASKREAHVRVALLQMALDITYKHPMMEACPSEWPCSQGAKEQLQQLLSPPELYTLLVSSTNGAGSEHHWTGVEGEPAQLASWAEHRRRRILERVVDSCEAFGVDLLVLPEYSVRLETVKWLKDHIANKRIAVLAGTYMEFRHDPPNKNLAAHLTLLWPVPRDISKLLVAPNDRRVDDQGVTADDLNRGLVLEFARKKKYRSIALNELFRPSTLPLAPLFKPEDLAAEILSQTGWEPSVKAVSALLSQTRLPLKHVLELVCSEIFLISSPANYLHMADDYVEIQRRFGEGADAEEVEKDLRELSRCLSITGDGKSTRRSILAVPAATSRSADYWIAGQASQLAAGTTSVFCNGAGPGVFVGGSCFVGRGSWRALNAEAGYLATITPYHGWSKGIYYSSEHDALSKKDQAVVIADIDPYNMLEGKPRPQTMPVPLQLVAYLPLVESIDWARTELNLLLSISSNSTSAGQATSVPSATPVFPLVDETCFWKTFHEAAVAPDEKRYESLWKKFSDPHALSTRAAAYWHDGAMQPSAGPYSHGPFVSPALYDWIDVSLTLKEKQTLPSIGVPFWIPVKKT